MYPFGELVEVLEPTLVETDTHDTVEDWSDPQVVDSDPGAALEDRPVGEFTDARNAITSGFTVYARADLNVTATSRIRTRGQVYDVIGEPAKWRSPLTGWDAGTVLQIGRTSG